VTLPSAAPLHVDPAATPALTDYLSGDSQRQDKPGTLRTQTLETVKHHLKPPRPASSEARHERSAPY